MPFPFAIMRAVWKNRSGWLLIFVANRMHRARTHTHPYPYILQMRSHMLRGNFYFYCHQRVISFEFYIHPFILIFFSSPTNLNRRVPYIFCGWNFYVIFISCFQMEQKIRFNIYIHIYIQVSLLFPKKNSCVLNRNYYVPPIFQQPTPSKKWDSSFFSRCFWRKRSRKKQNQSVIQTM